MDENKLEKSFAEIHTNSLYYRTLHRVQRLWQKIHERQPGWSSFEVFETDVGIKFRHGRFNSDKFNQFVIGEKALVEFPSITFSNLLLPPDLLKNKYTLCGRELLQSPHFRLMKAIGDGIFDSENEYVLRYKQGTLDARLPERLDPEQLVQKYQQRRNELKRVGVFTIHVVEVLLENKPSYIIVDGKHRAAMIASLGSPESLRLRLVSKNYSNEFFFKEVYTYCLNSDPGEYSINQQIIKAIINE
jgi:hypothetical protein